MPYIELTIWYLILIVAVAGFFYNRAHITDPVFAEDSDSHVESESEPHNESPASPESVSDYSQIDMFFDPFFEESDQLDPYEELEESDLISAHDRSDSFEFEDTIIDIDDHRDAPVEDYVLDHHDDFIMEMEHVG